MNKVVMSFSLVLVLVGTLMIPIGLRYKILKFASDGSKPAVVNNAWTISREFEKGRLLVFDMNPNSRWGLAAYDFKGDIPPGFSYLSSFLEENEYIYLVITVIDPLSRETNFTVLYLALASQDPAHPFRLMLYDVAVTSNDGGLSFEGLTKKEEGGFLYLNPSMGANVGAVTVFGITTCNGTYKVSFMDETLKSLGDPLKLELSSFLIVEEKPYFTLVPIGGIFLATGLISFYWFKRNIPRTAKRKRIHHSR